MTRRRHAGRRAFERSVSWGMTRRFRLAALIAILLPAPTAAVSQGPVPRAIPLPDTMGANFLVTDTVTGSSGPTDYDFLIGTWRFTFSFRAPPKQP